MIAWSCEITWLTKIFIYATTTMPMAIKRGRVGIYNEELSSIKSWNPLIKWSSKVTWNINSLVSLLQQVLWLPNLVRCLLTMRSFHPESHTTVWTCGYVKPRDISPLPQCLWPTNQAPLLHTMRSFPPLSQKIFWLLIMWSFKVTW